MKSKFYIALASTLISSFSFAQALKVNEIMATNNTYLSDLNNYGDWVEIYNPSNQEVDIAGYYVTDDYTVPTKYQIPIGNPSSIIAPGGYKIIWADDSTQNLHANFKISSNGERFALVASDGVTFIDSISFGPQTADVSYGRTSDGSDSWTFFTTSTPNASNAPAGISNVEISNSNNFAFPNPIESNLFVKGNNWDALRISDLTGKVVLELTNTLSKTNSLDVSFLTSGIYYISLTQKGKISTQKLNKM
jgi:hypothetical protein